jgi:hypothetical protein
LPSANNKIIGELPRWLPRQKNIANHFKFSIWRASTPFGGHQGASTTGAPVKVLCETEEKQGNRKYL